ncbi:MAG: DMT family transporter [Crocinitomicaceae bacterium]|nr:DMT family transporter [Crocinitomicaceae bacterium]
MGEKLKYYVILHIIVLIWGFTGILGDEISASADLITFFRTGISFLSLILIGFFIKNMNKLDRKQVMLLLLTGGIVGLHWYSFFYAIKSSTVSIGVVCMSSSTLFTSLLEPIIFKRKLLVSELILSFAIIAGIVIIFGFETKYYIGIISGLIAAFLAALFTVINGKLITQISSFKITKYEMLGGCLVLFIILICTNKINAASFNLPMMDWIYLLILGVICTSVAFMVSVWVMKYVTPFTVSMSVNMEPIYTILIVLLIGVFNGSQKEVMSRGFYVGALIIIASIFANAYIKKRINRRVKQKEILKTST